MIFYLQEIERFQINSILNILQGELFFIEEMKYKCGNSWRNFGAWLFLPKCFGKSSSSRRKVQKQQVNSVYGRLALSWNKLIYVEATGRNDWSSTLAGPEVPNIGHVLFLPISIRKFYFFRTITRVHKKLVGSIKSEKFMDTIKNSCMVFMPLIAFFYYSRNME